VNKLILKSCDLLDLGLFHGKMGLVIFFFHYAYFTKKSIYRKFAEQLLDEIFEDIHDRLTLDLENGYCGIGWGIEYLSQKKFIAGDTNEILESIDMKVMEWNLKRVKDLSLKNGIAGVFHYVLCRLKNKSLITPFDIDFLSDLEIVVSKNYITSDTELKVLFDYYREWLKNKELRYNPSSLLDIITKSNNLLNENQDVMNIDIGIENGCAGYVFKKFLLREFI
jgi:hypothetical protein